MRRAYSKREQADTSGLRCAGGVLHYPARREPGRPKTSYIEHGV
jgi:hypothetical protein